MTNWIKCEKATGGVQGLKPFEVAISKGRVTFGHEFGKTIDTSFEYVEVFHSEDKQKIAIKFVKTSRSGYRIARSESSHSFTISINAPLKKVNKFCEDQKRIFKFSREDEAFYVVDLTKESTGAA